MNETVTATFVFTDLVGSTALGSRLGPVGAEAVRAIHFGLLRGAMEENGGVEVKNLGDGLMVMFTSVARAISSAVAMQQAFEIHNRRADEPLAIRIGISTGEATEEDHDYFGDPVIEAARLCAKAEGKQILTTGMVAALLGRHSSQTLRSVGDLTLKGLPDPVPSFEVLWEPEAPDADAVVLPAKVLESTQSELFGFFGREAELEVLVATATEAESDRRPHLVLVAGEPGMGKTTTACHAAREFNSQGATVLFGRCDDGLATPFRPWIEALGHAVNNLPIADLAAHVDAHGALLAQWVAALLTRTGRAADPTSADSDHDRFKLFQAAVDLLERAAHDRLVVLVLDDLHWADSATLQLLRHLVTTEVHAPIAIFATYRDSDLVRGDQLTSFLADLRREPNITRLDLSGLDDIDVLALMEAVAGHELDGSAASFAHALRYETEGNPFFTGEVLLHLSSTGAIVLDEGGHFGLSGPIAELGLPASVRDVVGRRVDRLGEQTVGILSIASVIGEQFDLDLLVGLTDIDEDAVLEILDAACVASLISEDDEMIGRFRFLHGLVQQTLYQDLSATRRQRMHRRVAEALEALIGTDGAQPAALATHLLAGTKPVDAEKAIRYTRAAGDAAIEAHFPEEAVKWFGTALDLHLACSDGDDTLHADILLELGTAQRRAGRPEHRETLLAAAHTAEKLGDVERLVVAALSCARRDILLAPEDPEILAVVHTALEAVGDSDDAARVRLLATLAKITDQSDVEARRTFATEAVALAESTQNDELLIDALVTTYGSDCGPSTHDRRLEDTETSFTLAMARNDPSERLECCFTRMHVVTEAGEFDEFTDLLAYSYRLAKVIDNPSSHAEVLRRQTAWTLFTGDTELAEALIDELFQRTTALGDPTAALGFAQRMFVVRQMKGKWAEGAEPYLDACRRHPEATDARAWAAHMLAEIGRPDEALPLFPLDAAAIDALPQDITFTSAMAAAAETAVSLADTASAADLYKRLKPIAHLFPCSPVTTIGCLAEPVARLAVLLGRNEEAVDHFRRAVEANGRAGARFWTARSQLDLAEVLAQRRTPGEDAECTELVTDALTTARECEFTGLVTRAGTVADFVDPVVGG